MHESIVAVIALGFIEVGVCFVGLKYFEPAPTWAVAKLAAGVIAVASVPLVLPLQVRIETVMRLRYGYTGPRFAIYVILSELAVMLCLLLFYARYKARG